MKEIIIRRIHQNNGMLNYKIVFENGQTILIRNGETKHVPLENIPVKVHAKQGWIKSKDVTIDNSTTELILMNAKIMSRISFWLIVLFPATLILPMGLWEDYPVIKTISIVGCSIMLLWAIYAFTINRDQWITIDKKTTN